MMYRSLFTVILAVWLGCLQVQAKSVFAHFMLSNTVGFGTQDYANEISLAQEARIDGFAVNFAMNEKTTENLPLFFKAAEASNGFKLFLSFDYAGNVSFPADTVTSMINTYAASPAYFHRGSQPLVSTFEGPKAAPDWPAIKKDTQCFFIPSYSSLGAKKAVALGVADGLFSWSGWPNGPNRKDTEVDASYFDFMNGLPYMMPVSPWFFTNMPGFGKNWNWRGDHLWFDRWNQVWYLQPEFVQIISWNDFGESHYIGPLDERQYAAFADDKGKSPFNYVRGMPHDGWRDLLPFAIEMYKNNISTVTRETLVTWYHTNPGSACLSGGTTGNTASQQQTEYSPGEIAEDRVFYSALLGSYATATVTIGGSVQSVDWDRIPEGGIGLYHGSVPFNGATGNVVVSLSRGGLSVKGADITTDCSAYGGYNNWNAWVGSAKAASTISATPPLTLGEQYCVSGIGSKDFGAAHENFEGVCSFGCQYGYCPRGPCTCMAMGAKVPDTTPLNIDAFPGAGMTCTWEGLCSYCCNHDYCPVGVCSTDASLKGKCLTPQALPEPEPVPDDPVTQCVSGKGEGNFGGLCDYSCGRGFCPEPCECLVMGNPVTPPITSDTGYPINDLGPEYDALCDFTCSRGYCPISACSYSDGTWYYYGGYGETYTGAQNFKHTKAYVRGSNGATDNTTRDWCENVQGNYGFPSLVSQSANDMHWMSLSCSMPEVVNTGFKYSSAERWAATEAWNALYQFWLCWTNPIAAATYPNLHLHSWSEGIFNYFHGPDYQNCELYGHGCNTMQSCTEAGHPAGFMIMNSFVTLHNVQSRFRAQMDEAWTEGVITQAEACISSFSPNIVKDDTQWLKIVLDIIGLGFAIAAAPVWNIALKSSPRWKGTANQNKLGTIKDTTNSIVSGGITIIKDSISPQSTTQGAKQQLLYMAGAVKDAWQSASDASLLTLFNGDYDNFVNFANLVDEGSMLDDLNHNNASSKAYIKRALWATLIPWAWSLSNDQHHPFVMIPNNVDSYYGCTKPADLDDYIDPDNQEAALNCVGNWPYYLVSVKDACSTCSQVCTTHAIGGINCVRNKFRLLPGIDQLIPETNIWGVTRDMMVQGSVASFKKYGQGAKVDQSDPMTFNDFGDEDALKGPGFFTFPVCTAEEAFTNLGKARDDNNKNYPCNA